MTTYALGEMSEQQGIEFLNELSSNGMSQEEIALQVEEIKQLTEALKVELAKDDSVRLSSDVRESVMKPTQSKKSLLYWLLGGLSSVSVAVVAFLVIDQNNEYISVPTSRPENFELSQSEPVMELEEDLSTQVSIAKTAPARKKSKRVMKSESRWKSLPTHTSTYLGGVKGGHFTRGMDIQRMEREAYDKIDTNDYKLVMDNPLSTLSVDVDTASYANMRRFLLKGMMPQKDSLRVEELINYFHYDYDFKNPGHPIAIKVDQTKSIWNKGRKIVRVALKADSKSRLSQASKNLVFLLDVSGSMSDPKKLPLLKESMQLLLRKLKKSDTVAIVVYAGAAGVVLEPTKVSEKIKILGALDNLRAGGSTNGGAGIKAAYKMAKQGFVKNGVNRIVLATDGDFNVGTSSQSELISLIEDKAKQDIFLTVVGLGTGNLNDSLLEKISNRGNGNYAYIDSLSEANKLFNIDLEKNLTTVAKDVKVQVEFNPNMVSAYRLIGYENRSLKAKDFNDDKKDAGEMGAGHTVTVLYEIVPKGEKLPEIANIDKLKYAKRSKDLGNNKELLTVKVRYKKPDGDKSTKFQTVLKNDSSLKADRDFNFAMAVASLGMKLRGDKMVQELRYREIESLAKDNKGRDPYDFREEFLEMIDLAKQIDK
jgi:Ca-activated chloride channel family protein